MTDKIAKIIPGRDSLDIVRSDAATYPRIGAMKQNDAISALMQVVANLFTAYGKPIEREDAGLLALALYNDIMMEDEYMLRCITLEEILRAVNRAKGNGDLYLNEASIYQAIHNYYKTMSMPANIRIAANQKH